MLVLPSATDAGAASDHSDMAGIGLVNCVKFGRRNPCRGLLYELAARISNWREPWALFELGGAEIATLIPQAN